MRCQVIRVSIRHGLLLGLFLTALAGLAACDDGTAFRFQKPDGDADSADNFDFDLDPPQTDGDSDSSDSDLSDSDPDGNEGEVDWPILLRMRNAGDQAAYVHTGGVGWPEENGFTVLDSAGSTVALSAPCIASCGDPCEPIFCEPAEPQVRQILPGEFIELPWDGMYYRMDSCQNEDFGTVQCAHYEPASEGDYSIRFCWATLLDVMGESWPERRRGDVLAPAYPDNMECVTSPPMRLDAEEHQALDFDFTATLDIRKPWAYCGQAWSYSPYAPSRFAIENPEGREGRSVVVPIMPEPGGWGLGCWRWDGMQQSILADAREVLFRHGSFIGERSCEQNIETVAYEHVLPPLDLGEWSLVVDTGAGMTPVETTLTVAACPECLACDGPDRDIGGECSGDCDCGDALCEDVCARPCLSNEDCADTGMHCFWDERSSLPQGRCAPMAESEDECRYDYDCEKGFLCQTDPDGGVNVCRRTWDMRGIGSGLGIHCGCDAECPGTQRCVRFQINFTDGFCAVPCRDDRDCGPGWSCLGMTQSGLEAICVQYLEN
ncbi:MAG: hypothetical protein C4523_15865 [Myxococcales bacterium]|nr:MAG: hypothetical protein C4523_15865 [Myxococcales bacterium]